MSLVSITAVSLAKMFSCSVGIVILAVSFSFAQSPSVDQEDIYKHQMAALRKIPFLRGTSPWILKDFRSPHRQLPGVQDGYNRKGLISESGDRKKAFYVLQKFYRELAAQTGTAAQ